MNISFTDSYSKTYTSTLSKPVPVIIEKPISRILVPSCDVTSVSTETGALKPIIKYPGGKGRELKHILPAVPKNINRFFEPFVGGGATYFSLGNISQYYINDASKELIATYNAVKFQDDIFLHTLSTLNQDWNLLSNLDYNCGEFDVQDFNYLQDLTIINAEELKIFFVNYATKMFAQKKAYIQKLINNDVVITSDNKVSLLETVLKSSYYATVRKIYNQNRKDKRIDENAAYYFFIREFCYSSMFRFSTNGDFNVPYGGMSYNSKNFDNKLQYLSSQNLRSRLDNTKIYDLDFQEFVEMFRFDSDDFIFVDPPYDTEFSTYDEIEFVAKDQIRLAGVLRSTKAKWLLIIKDTDFIRSLYPVKDSHLFYREFGKNYSVSFMNRNDRSANHLMITNYEV